MLELFFFSTPLFLSLIYSPFLSLSLSSAAVEALISAVKTQDIVLREAGCMVSQSVSQSVVTYSASEHWSVRPSRADNLVTL
jgi:hypothetical protein